MIPKKLAVINDISGFGRCSLTVALPVISTLKVQACPVPTSVFSNHTGFADWYCHDLTENLPEYLQKWETLNLCFDGIYCGYLGSRRQIDIVIDFLKTQNLLCEHTPDKTLPLILVDPVMGDNGRIYSGITEAHCEGMKELIRYSKILTPNLTEACLLTGVSYDAVLSDFTLIEKMLSTLHEMGPTQIALTGVLSGGQFCNYISDRTNQTFSIYKTPVAGQSRPGTGDLFASIVAAECLNGSTLSVSVQKAADFISLCIAHTESEGVPTAEGVCFESLLSALIPQ